MRKSIILITLAVCLLAASAMAASGRRYYHFGLYNEDGNVETLSCVATIYIGAGGSDISSSCYTTREGSTAQTFTGITDGEVWFWTSYNPVDVRIVRTDSDAGTTTVKLQSLTPADHYIEIQRDQTALGDVTLGTVSRTGALTATGAATHGVSGTGVDNTWYGDTASTYVLWDASADGYFFNLIGTPFIFEGATADAHETTVTVTDPTADITWVFPDAATDTFAFMASTLVTNAPDIANSVTGGTNQLIFEGTADAHECILTATDATADTLYTLPDAAAATYGLVTSTLAANGVDIVNAIWGGTNQLIMEGATADAFETIITPNDATADATLALPDDSGDVVYAPEGVVDYAAGAGALPLTHTIITYASQGGAEALTLADGKPGQILQVNHDTDGGNGVITPATALGYTSVDLADDGDMVTFLFVDTQGWIIIGTAGNAAPPVVTP